MGIFSLSSGRRIRARRLSERLARPRLESLEERWNPYAVSGNAWPHPELVTLSFMPDGTNVGSAFTNLFSQFNTYFLSESNWKPAFLKAAQAWAQQTNL